MPHLEYVETIRTYVDLFGRENVYILLFEDFKNDPAGFIARICGAMGVDPEAGVPLTAGRVDNARWTTTQIDRLKLHSSSMTKSLQFRMAGRAARREMLDLDVVSLPVVTHAHLLGP